MFKRWKMLIGFILMFVAGGVAGAAIGGYLGFKAGFTMVLNEALAGDAQDVSSRVASLRELRGGQHDKAIASIEARMDDTLIMFDPATPHTGLKAHTIGEIRKAIDQAKAYRAEYPHSKEDRLRGPMVRSIFERDLYK